MVRNSFSPASDLRHSLRKSLKPYAVVSKITFRAWKVRHGLHQCRHLNWQIGPKRNLRTMQELCCSRAPGALVRCDGNEISAIDLVEDKLVRVRNAGRRLKVGR